MKAIATIVIVATALFGCATQHSFSHLDASSERAGLLLDIGIMRAGELDARAPERVPRLRYLERLNNLKVGLDLLRVQASLGSMTSTEARVIEDLFEIGYETIGRYSAFPGQADEQGLITQGPAGQDVIGAFADVETAIAQRP